MKIEEITQVELDQLVAGITSSAKEHILRFSEQKHEDALIDELKASGKSDRERLREYFQRTKLKPVQVNHDRLGFDRTNSYVREKLKIAPQKFKALRDELETERVIAVFTMDGSLVIRAFRTIGAK
jgi:hypothetical protein